MITGGPKLFCGRSGACTCGESGRGRSGKVCLTNYSWGENILAELTGDHLCGG